MNEKQLQALAKKNAAKAQRAQKQPTRSYDATVEATRPKNEDETGEVTRLFKEMKRREF